MQAWFRALTAEERGELLTRARDEEARAAVQAAPAPDADVLDGVRALRVRSPVIPQPLRNRLRWAPERYTALEAHLASGPALTLDERGRVPVWRAASGERIRSESVRHLLEAGVLTRP